jgi:aryl-phospho-beta-D-glucosidase BglC (GH1 family)
MRWFLLAAVVAWIAAFGLAVPAMAQEGAGPGRAIRVQGNQFVDALGETVVFRGLCFSDPDKLEKAGQWNARYLDEAKAWGANIVRFAIHPRAWRERGRDAYLALVDQGIEWARERDLAVILDWHSIGNLRTELYQHPMYDTTRKETFEFWRTVSGRYAGNPAVILYEIYNEPTTFQGRFGRLSWTQWKELVEEIIGIIRAHEPTAIVLVGGRDWAYELREVVADPINAEAVAYVSHPYPQKREPPWEPQWEMDWGHVADRYPVFVTEFGFERGGHIPTDSTPEYGHAILDYMKKKGISWTAWCFDPDWTPTLIEDWDFTPTEQGALFKAELLGQPRSAK